MKRVLAAALCVGFAGGIAAFALAGADAAPRTDPGTLSILSAIRVREQSPWSPSLHPFFSCESDGGRVTRGVLSQGAYLDLWAAIEEAGIWNLADAYGDNGDASTYHIEIQAGGRTHRIVVGGFTGEEKLFTTRNEKGMERVRNEPYRKVLLAISRACGKTF